MKAPSDFIAMLPPTTSASARAAHDEPFLVRNRACYEALVEFILRHAGRLGPEAVLGLIAETAGLAAAHHPGRFADARLENLVLQTGTELDALIRHKGMVIDRLVPSDPAPSGRRQVLHVATEVSGIGGHTRTIKNWALADSGSVHSLVLTEQPGGAIPEWLARALADSGGRVIILPRGAHLLALIKWTRQAAAGADLVVSHHFPGDVVTTAAFATPGGPPVAILNHADHVFWLGSSVADTILNQRQIGLLTSESRRGARHNSLLPIPMHDCTKNVSQAAARRALSIDSEWTVLLSIGRAMKYVPSPTHDFFRAARRILDHNARAHLYLVGVPTEFAERYMPGGAHERLHCMGWVEDPSLYQAAADVYLEGFPFGSQTAMLEAAMAGLPAVPAFSPCSPLLATSDEALDGVLATPVDEDDYVGRAGDLIADPVARREIGGLCRRRVVSCHTDEGWRQLLSAFYDTVDALDHDPRPIAMTPSLATADDCGLSRFHAFAAPGVGWGNDPRPMLVRVPIEASYAARHVGDYRSSWRLLHAAGRTWGYDAKIAGALVKMLPRGVIDALDGQRGRARVHRALCTEGRAWT